MSTTPFELRLQMLQMAKDYLDQQYHITRDAMLQGWQTSVDYANKMSQEIPMMPDIPKMYDIKEITKMAETFNDFVSGKK